MPDVSTAPGIGEGQGANASVPFGQAQNMPEVDTSGPPATQQNQAPDQQNGPGGARPGAGRPDRTDAPQGQPQQPPVGTQPPPQTLTQQQVDEQTFSRPANAAIPWAQALQMLSYHPNAGNQLKAIAMMAQNPSLAFKQGAPQQPQQQQQPQQPPQQPPQAAQPPQPGQPQTQPPPQLGQ